MKYIVQICRIFVGVLFIISGFIKLNDPLGFSYKLQEYFSTDVLNIPFLEPYALAISVFVVVLEVVLGVFLLIGYKRKFTIWMLLGMIVFFTFLTFYSAYFDKVKDCGCFGDALKLTPWESFTKDVVLLVLILILFYGQKYIKPIFKTLPNTIVALLSFIVSLWFAYHVLMHLPSIDFRAYKIGNNLSDEMAIPENAARPVIEYTWTYKINGEEKTYVDNGSGPAKYDEVINVETKEIDPGFIPSIQDFTIESNDEDLTTYFLEKDNLVVVAMYNIYNSEKEGLEKLKSFTDDAIKKGYTVIGLSASGDEAKQQLKTDYNLNFDTYLCDEKVVKTIVRSNPGIFILNKGTVINKAHWSDIEDIELEILENANLSMDFELKKELDKIYALDQGIREIYFAKSKEEKDAIAQRIGIPVKENTLDYMNLWGEIDSVNMVKVEKIVKDYGYPGKSLVGEPTNKAAWYVIQHSQKIEQYLPLMKEASNKGELPKHLVAMMEDRHLMYNGKPQIYGTQGRTIGMKTDNPIQIIWPIADVENVNSL
ncbi:BT_3928 family protein [uncultured Winogradskyella sp.]|uniref:BT_3928 family protein n=1 Tax=uncultured Winogradskyella sp. TaxID=395353 RepID=UPI00260D6078|nr:BT_3928 family protein [uncultured Winogradskyella sp.]